MKKTELTAALFLIERTLAKAEAPKKLDFDGLMKITLVDPTDRGTDSPA